MFATIDERRRVNSRLKQVFACKPFAGLQVLRWRPTRSGKGRKWRGTQEVRMCHITVRLWWRDAALCPIKRTEGLCST
jgi:hypothetical protein